ncbi:MAG TPA: ABC transporter permease [Candidatus Aminicenantes bacterium]|nr:ABC transporter permease [Candidatus Aminicenantes bacterium]
MKKPANRFEWMIALRFLLRGRAQTLLIVLGIAVGVAVQFFLSALISGLQVSLIDNTIGAAPHLLALPADRLPAGAFMGGGAERRDSGRVLIDERTEIQSWQTYVDDLRRDRRVLRASPVANGQGFIERGGAVIAVIVKGLVAPDGLDIYKIREKTVAGAPELASDTALLGQRIAERLTLAVGDKFVLRNDRGGRLVMRVGAVFDLGAAAGNDLLAAPMDQVRSFFAIGGVSAVEAQVRDVFAAEEVARDHGRQYARVKLESWQERNRQLLTGLRSQSTSSVTIQFFVIVSISLAIASVLGIAAVQKQRQLGILKAMGTSDRSASRIFVIQGLLLGGIGSLLGLGLGLLMGWGFVAGTDAAFGLEISARTLLTPIALALAAAVTASTIPARKAAALSPIEVIRNG